MRTNMQPLGISRRLDSHAKVSSQPPLCQILQSYRDRSSSCPIQLNVATATAYRQEAYNLHTAIANSIAANRTTILMGHPERASWINNAFTVAVSDNHCAASGGGSSYVGNTVTGKTRIWDLGKHAEMQIIDHQKITNLGVDNDVCSNCKPKVLAHQTLEHCVDPHTVHLGLAATASVAPQKFLHSSSDDDYSPPPKRFITDFFPPVKK